MSNHLLARVGDIGADRLCTHYEVRAVVDGAMLIVTVVNDVDFVKPRVNCVTSANATPVDLMAIMVAIGMVPTGTFG
jgi:hypothetical protein